MLQLIIWVWFFSPNYPFSWKPLPLYFCRHETCWCLIRSGIEGSSCFFCTHMHAVLIHALDQGKQWLPGFTRPEHRMKPFGFYYSIYSCPDHKVVLRACFIYSAALPSTSMWSRLNKPSTRAQLQQQPIDWRQVTVWTLRRQHAGFSRWGGSCNLRLKGFCACLTSEKL